MTCTGSAGYGFWYRLLDFPEGPSFTTNYCPKFVALRRFANNVAHSNMFYGLRIHPEYYPKTNPCDSTFQQLPAVFDGFIGYKNGVKGAMCTQVGLVQLRNFTVADNGVGPRVHVINGKGGLNVLRLQLASCSYFQEACVPVALVAATKRWL
jgi:hypothetical protein